LPGVRVRTPGGHANPSAGVRSPRRRCSWGTSANRPGAAPLGRERRASGGRGGPGRAQGAAVGAADPALRRRAIPLRDPSLPPLGGPPGGRGQRTSRIATGARSGSALQLSRGDVAAHVAARTRLHARFARLNRRNTPHCGNKRRRSRSVALVRRRPAGILQRIDRCGGSRRRDTARGTCRPRRRDRLRNTARPRGERSARRHRRDALAGVGGSER